MKKDENGKITGSEPVDERTISPEMSLISIPDRGVSIEKEIAEIEKNIEFFNRVKIVALKMTKISDWIDQGGSPYLMDRGAENVAIAFGVDISDVQLRMEWAEDGRGRYYTFIASGKAYAKKLARYVEDIGVCSQRDRFFGMLGGKFKEIDQVDMANIRRKAVTNLYSRLIKRVIGLMGVTFDDLKLAGMDVSKIQKVEYKGGAQKGAEPMSGGAAEAKEKLIQMLNMMANGDKEAIANLLEKFSSWNEIETLPDGQKKKGKLHSVRDISKLSEKWLMSVYGKVKAEYEKTAAGPEREAGQEG